MMHSLLFLIMALLSIPVMVFAMQVLGSLLTRLSKPVSLPSKQPAKYAVLVPAHNESVNLLPTLDSLKSKLGLGHDGNSSARIVVIADNCSDDTAALAREQGVEVIERHDVELRGKGYALDFGVRYLKDSGTPPDVVMIVDADCLIAHGTLAELANLSLSLNRPVQGLYLMLSAEGAGLKTKVAEFAWKVKNLVRPLGYRWLNPPCPLMGSGMAFPWKQIANAQLASGNIVEDVKLGVDLALAGYPAVFYPDVSIVSYFPNSEHAQATQRKRWEHGHLSTIIEETPRLLSAAMRTKTLSLFWMALDLLIPPLALLVLLLLGITVAVFALEIVLGGFFAQLTTMVFLNGLLFLAVLVAWAKWAREILPARFFLLVPWYILQKVPNYLLYPFKKQKSWVRTNRD